MHPQGRSAAKDAGHADFLAREECLEQAGEEIGGASVAAKAKRRSRSRPTKPFEETVRGADPLSQNNGETGKYRCLNQ